MEAIYFVRHGESEFNARGLVAGQLDIALTDTGRQQARTAGEWAKEHGLHFDVIVSSDLKRAHETAELIAKVYKYPLAKIIIMPELRERSCGDFEGGPVDAYYETPEATSVHEHGVESLDKMYARTRQAVTVLNKRFPGKSVLLVSHSGIGKMFRLMLDGRDAAEMDKTVSIPNATIFRIG